MRRLTVLILVLTLLSFAAPATAAPGVVVRPLGGIGGQYAFAYAMNGRGDVAGVGADPAGVLQPVFWPGGRSRPVNLGVTIRQTTEPVLSEHGTVAGSTAEADLFLWRGGTPVVIDGGDRFAYPTGINGRDQVVGWRWAGDGSDTRGWLWDRRSGFTEIGVLPGYSTNYPAGINDRGQVIGNLYGAGPQGYVWQRGVLTPLGAGSSVTGINERGQVAGLIGSTPFRWQAGRFTMLPAAGAVTVEVRAINGRGEVAGTLDGRPVKWLADGALRYLGPEGSEAYGVRLNDRGDAAMYLARPDPADPSTYVYGLYRWRNGTLVALTDGADSPPVGGIDERGRVIANPQDGAGGPPYAAIYTVR